MDFMQILRDIEHDWAILETLLPFVLIFVITFAVLEKMNMFGQNDGKMGKKINGTIAAILGLLVVIPHALNPSDGTVVGIILNSVPAIVALIIAAVLALVLTTSVTGEQNEAVAGKKYIAYVALAIVLYIFAQSAWDLPFFDAIRQETINLIVILLVFGLVIFLIVYKSD
ncbi:MAG: hypothetical protein ACOCZQ_00190 [Nanoarchaeota archaeon]